MNNQLALMQLADSFFPSGSFTVSHGLEYLVQSKQIETPQQLKTYLQILLHNKIGSCDLVALIHAYRGSQNNNISTIINADKQLYSQTLVAKNRQTMQKSGRALLMVAQQIWQDNKLEQLQLATDRFFCLHPVVFGVVAQIAGIDERNTALAFLHSLITSLNGAAIRLGVIGHIQAQKIILALASDITNAYTLAQSLDIDRMWSCTPTIDLAQIQHQQLRTKLFAN